MKPYVYLSEEKVNDHYIQVPQKIGNTAKIKQLRFSIPFLKFDVDDATTPDNRYTKLERVLQYLVSENKVGECDNPNQYFGQSLRMKYGIYPESNLVYFSGESNGVIVGLTGSAVHMIGEGEIGELAEKRLGGSAAIGMQRGLSKEIPLQKIYNKYIDGRDSSNLNDSKRIDLLSMTVAHVNKRIDGPEIEVEFVAIRLAEGKYEGQKTLLGSPLYVAYAR